MGALHAQIEKCKGLFLKGWLKGGFQKVGAGGLSKSLSFWGAPNLEPRWPPDPPTWSQDNLLTPQLGAKMAPGPPTWSQDGPQSSNLEPRWPPDLPTWSLNDHRTLKSRHGGGARRQAVGYTHEKTYKNNMNLYKS